jgi:putative DNA primase/helicase
MSNLVHLEKAERAAKAAVKPGAIVTEDSAALEFARRHVGQLLFDHDAGRWLRWTGSHWRIETTKIAFDWARALARELSANETPKARLHLSKVSFATGVERFAQADRAFAVTSDGWDSDPWLLATPSGTVDLKTGLLRSARPDDRITKVAAAEPAPTVDCPRFLQFMDEATGGDVDLIRFLQQWCGYCLTGVTREHALVFLHGGGGEGKTTFVNATAGAIGAYATVAAMDTFIASYGDRHPTDLAMLRGARLVTASETEEGRAWAESKIKQLTGGDQITARFMRQDFFTFTPTFKLTILGNHRPVLRNVDDAARRRFNIVPFTRKPANPDPHLEAKLRAEWPGILRWMIEGCLGWQTTGLIRSKAVLAATNEYFSDEDVFGQWLADECDAERGNPHKVEKSSDLFSSWTDYATKAGEKAGSAKAFGSQMMRHGFEPYRHWKDGRTYRGIRLKRARQWDDDPQGDHDA